MERLRLLSSTETVVNKRLVQSHTGDGVLWTEDWRPGPACEPAPAAPAEAGNWKSVVGALTGTDKSKRAGQSTAQKSQVFDVHLNQLLLSTSPAME